MASHRAQMFRHTCDKATSFVAVDLSLSKDSFRHRRVPTETYLDSVVEGEDVAM